MPGPTTANQEFADLMPHRIQVVGEGTGYDDYGDPINAAEPRVYICLIDDTTTRQRTAAGVEITVALTAYVAPVPIGFDAPVDIKENETLRVLLPYDEVKSINSVERHYDAEDGEGMLHNIVVRMG